MMKMSGTLGVLVIGAMYLGTGAFMHALLLGQNFDVSNLWSWGVLFGWPVIALAATLALVLAFSGALIVSTWVGDVARAVRRLF
jgi:hypothetical protein